MTQCIQGIGIDIVDIRRIAKLLNRYPIRLPHRILHHTEYSTYQKKNSLTSQVTYLARQFAAKEAISKALGTGMSSGYYAKNIIVQRNSQGQPTANLSDSKKSSDIHIQISIADEKHYAVAHAICYLVTG